MPFIKRNERPQFDNVLAQLPLMGHKGHLEYCIYKLLSIYADDRPWRYVDLHDVVYAGIHAAEEWKRVNLDTYENDKRIENGEIEA